MAGVGFAADHGEAIFAVEPVGAHIVDEACDEEVLLLAFGEIGRERRRIAELREADAGMRAARPRDDRKVQFARDVLTGDPVLGEIGQLRARRVDGRGNVQTRHTSQQPIQLVAIEIADAIRRIEQRPRPVRRGLFNQRERLAAFLGIGRDHDGDVVLGQGFRQTDALDHIECQQLDVGAFEQEIDRRVAAHVDVGRKREHVQAGLRSRTGRPEELMKGQHFRLDRKPLILVAQKLGDQGEIQPFARQRDPRRDPRHELVAQRMQIDAFEGLAGQLRKADAVGIVRRGQADRRRN
ncbi:hypothetical protein H1B27_38695 [Bradyrhizobium sp. CNPSo 4019]|uniref:Uncharacterized protein n=1 Tax=Bradyrhizobium diversitatis TaxID=2755406 RepID=A0ABS0PGB3_9BRAD|nr:hypothetical protein [Bradyrhizobium diversitatis]